MKITTETHNIVNPYQITPTHVTLGKLQFPYTNDPATFPRAETSKDYILFITEKGTIQYPLTQYKSWDIKFWRRKSAQIFKFETCSIESGSPREIDKLTLKGLSDFLRQLPVRTNFILELTEDQSKDVFPFDPTPM